MLSACVVPAGVCAEGVRGNFHTAPGPSPCTSGGSAGLGGSGKSRSRHCTCSGCPGELGEEGWARVESSLVSHELAAFRPQLPYL